MSDDKDALDDLLGAIRPRRDAGSALDDMTKAAASTRSAGDALDELIAGSGARPRSASTTSESDRVEVRKRWATALALALGGVGMSGVLTESVAASQLLTNSDPLSLALVWPLGGLGLLFIAFAQSGFVDRFARLHVVRAIFLGYSALFVATLVLFATDISQKVPAAIAWLLADQMNFLLPLVVWAVAGDVFTTGQGVTIFPRISRWLFGGQVTGLGIAVLAPVVFDPGDISLAWLLVIPPVIAVAVALLLPRALADATTGLGHQREQSAVQSVRDTISFIRDLPAYRWIFWTGLLAILGGTMVDFGFLHLADTRYTDAESLQIFYAGTSLACFVLCWLLQTFGASRMLNKHGVARVLQLLPIGALLGSVALVIGGATETIALAAVALVLWRLPRWSIDGSARQAAMANLPDERRLRASFVIDMTPLALSLIVAAGPIALAAQFDNLWIAPAIGAALAVIGGLLSRNTVRTWDDTQLSYRLKRRKRLG